MLKLIREDTIKPVPVDSVDVETDVNMETANMEDIPDSIVANACQDVVNNLIQAAWNFISEVNAAIATIDYDFKDETIKKETVELLNTIVDDSTINIGILHKVFELLNSEKANLLASGENKAEEILNNETEAPVETE